MNNEKRPVAADYGALGYRDEFVADDLISKHIDGPSGLVFESEEAYLAYRHPEEGAKRPEGIAHYINQEDFDKNLEFI